MRNCHRVVLSAYSDHFEAALCNTESCPSVTLDIDSEITGVSSPDLRRIIDFMYYAAVRPMRMPSTQLVIASRSLGVIKLSELLAAQELSLPTVNHSSSTAFIQIIYFYHVFYLLIDNYIYV